MSKPDPSVPISLSADSATHPRDPARWDSYRRRRLESTVGERARHDAWTVNVAHVETIAVVAFGSYYYGHPDGAWRWSLGVVDGDRFTPVCIIAEGAFKRGTPDGNMSVYHLSPEDRRGPLQRGPVALVAHFDYGRHSEAWVATDPDGREVWMGDFQEDTSVMTRHGVELRSEAAAGQIQWTRFLRWRMPEFGAYTSLCKRLVDPVKPALPTVPPPSGAELSTAGMRRER